MPKNKTITSINFVRITELILVITLLIFSAINISSKKEEKVLGLKSEISFTTQEKISFLNDLIVTHPNYFDGLIELSKLNLLENNIESSIATLKTAENVNPNHREIKLLKKEIENVN